MAWIIFDDHDKDTSVSDASDERVGTVNVAGTG